MTLVEVGGIRLHCRVQGPPDDHPLVLVNSLGTELSMWEPQVDTLASRFRVIRYDARGHGRSDVPPGPYTMEHLGLDLAGLLHALHVERAHVCGLSLGGMTALWLAASRPELVERAVVVSAAPRIGTPERWEARVAAVREGGMAAVVEPVLELMLTGEFRERHPEVVRRLTAALAAASPEGYIASCLALRDGDLGELIRDVRAYTLIVAGSADASTPPAEAERLHALIPRSEVVVLDGAAHLCNVERAEAFTAAVMEFLTRKGTR